MDDLRRRFADLDRVPVPDLWDTIELRAVAHDPVARVTALVTPLPTRSRQSTRRSFVLLAATVALLVALVAGAVAIGSRSPLLPAVVPPVPSDALRVAPVPSTSETPTETATPTASPNAWITGQQLADLLSSENGYKWVSVDQSDGRTILQLDQPEADRISIQISPPFDSRATVAVSDFALEPGAETLGPDVDRIAQALAPDAATWIHDAFTQGMRKTGGGSAASDTANGGSVGVIVVDEIVMKDSVTVWFSPDPLPPVRTEPIGPGSVVYADSGLIRVANPDGTDAGTLLGGAFDARVPGATDVARILGWSPDGSRLIYIDSGGKVMSTDATGSEPTLIGRSDRPQDRCTHISDAAQQAKCVADLAGIRELCPAVAVDETCEPDLDEVLISPDGTRLAYPISYDSGRVIGFLDIATGQVTRIAFDSARSPACDGPFGDGPLQWSPDGTRFAFGNSVGPRVDGWCQGAVFTVNVDGTDLRRVNSSKVHAMGPRWSPDGSTIAFSRSTPRSAWDRKGDATRIPLDMDIYSVRPDGSDLTALTSDGVSIDPIWTRDGRIVYHKMQAEGRAELWIMDADGENATQLDTTVAAQAAAGCTVCPYPDAQGRYGPSESGPLDGPFLRFWRPGQP